MIKSLPILLFFLPVVCFAQPKITTSTAFETDSKGTLSTLGLLKTGQGDNFLMVYRSAKLGSRFGPPKVHYTWAADVFTPDLKKLSGSELKKIEFPDGEDAEYGFAVNFGGGPYLLLQEHKKKEGKMIVYHCAIDQTGAIGKPKRLGSYSVREEESGSYRGVHISPDSATLLLIFLPSLEDPKDPISFIAFDRNWSTLQTGKLPMPNIDANILIKGIYFGEHSEIWMPAWVKANDQESLQQELWVWRDLKAAPQRIDVQLAPDKLITDMDIARSETDGAIYVAGLYGAHSKKALKSMFRSSASSPRDKHPAQGTFFLKIDPEKQTIDTRHEAPFRSQALRFWALSEKDIEKGEGISILGVQEIAPQPDGSIFFTVEQYFEDAGSPINPANPTGLRHSGGPRCGPAIAVHYDASGKQDQEVLLKKQVMSVHGSGVGHRMFTHRGAALFVYNDHEDNIARPPEQNSGLKPCRVADVEGMVMGQKDAFTAMYYVDKAGRGNPKALFNFKEAGYWFDRHACLKLSPTRYILGCDGRTGQYGLLRVDMPE